MLSIRNLSHTYPNGVQAMKRINLDIQHGMFGLLGPNGAGKSSLMRTIATLQQPTTGSIRFGAVDVLEHPNEARKTLGYLPQDFGVYPRGSAYDLLDHIAVLKGLTHGKTRKKVVERLLVETNLYQVRKKRLATFSGGMRQRFGIAQALLGDPKLLIVDEPTGGLDPEERNRFHNLLAEIGEHRVVILSTHIVEDVADLCTRMAVMAQGSIVSEGKPTELISTLKHRIWQKVIPKTEIHACKSRYRVLSHHLSAGKTVIRIWSEKDPGHGFRPAEPNLGDVYFEAIASVSQQGSGHSSPDASHQVETTP